MRRTRVRCSCGFNSLSRAEVEAHIRFVLGFWAVAGLPVPPEVGRHEILQG